MFDLILALHLEVNLCVITLTELIKGCNKCFIAIGESVLYSVIAPFFASTFLYYSFFELFSFAASVLSLSHLHLPSLSPQKEHLK